MMAGQHIYQHATDDSLLLGDMILCIIVVVDGLVATSLSFDVLFVPR